MHKEESVQENKTHKILLDFELQTDPEVLAITPDLGNNQQNEKKKKNSERKIERENLPSSGFC